MGRVTHFELPTTDAAKSRNFYETVFGWQFTKWGEFYERMCWQGQTILPIPHHDFPTG